MSQHGCGKGFEMTENRSGNLDADLEMGPVDLRIADLERSIDFYQRAIGLVVLDKGDDWAELGPEGEAGNVVVSLHEHPGARPAPRNTSGLYHFAILVPDRQALGRALRNLLERETPLQGASDHLVSEAIYLADPDGNGIEIYRDRDREEWVFDQDELRMATLPLDVSDLLRTADGAAQPFTMPHGTQIGHVHLHVGSLPAAEHFYIELVGFELVTRYGRQAAFLSEGGYHHHLGLNTWAGEGAPPPPLDAAGLISFTVVLSSQHALEGLESRLTAASIEFSRGDDTLDVRDPFENLCRFRLAPPGG